MVLPLHAEIYWCFVARTCYRLLPRVVFQVTGAQGVYGCISTVIATSTHASMPKPQQGTNEANGSSKKKKRDKAGPEPPIKDAAEADTPRKKKSKAVAPSANDAAGPSSSAQLARTKGRNYTISMAVPGSVVAAVNGSAELAAAIAGQIARAAVAGCIDEVVVYDDDSAGPSGTGAATVSAAAAFLAQALQYLETPPYLRQALCPIGSSDVLASLQALGPLHAPHHLNQTDWLPFRDGIVLKSSAPKAGTAHGHSFVDIGLDRMAYVPAHMPVGARVTVSVGDQPTASFVPEYSETMITAEVVPAITPRLKHGMYWGFSVRLSPSLHEVTKGSIYKSGYDLTIGTSARGIERDHADLVLPRFSHLLLVFGGATKGLEEIMQQEEPLAHKSPEDYFNMYLNVCPGQGSSSIRTEDAVLMALGYLRPALLKFGGNVTHA